MAVDFPPQTVLCYAVSWVNCRVVLHKLRGNRADGLRQTLREGQETRRSKMDYKKTIAALAVAATATVAMAEGIVSSSVIS